MIFPLDVTPFQIKDTVIVAPKMKSNLIQWVKPRAEGSLCHVIRVCDCGSIAEGQINQSYLEREFEHLSRPISILLTVVRACSGDSFT